MDGEYLKNNLTINVGNGKIVIGENVIPYISNNHIFITVRKEKGPCVDQSCQIITKVNIQKLDKIPDDAIRVEKNGISLFLNREVANSIDRGRENVLLKKTLAGKIGIRGFTYIGEDSQSFSDHHSNLS